MFKLNIFVYINMSLSKKNLGKLKNFIKENNFPDWYGYKKIDGK